MGRSVTLSGLSHLRTVTDPLLPQSCGPALPREHTLGVPPAPRLLWTPGKMFVFTSLVSMTLELCQSYCFAMGLLPVFPEIFVCPNRGSPSELILIYYSLLLALYPFSLICLLCLHTEEFIHICLIWGLSSCYQPAPNTGQYLPPRSVNSLMGTSPPYPLPASIHRFCPSSV